MRKNEWLRWLTFPFLEAWLNMSPWLPACCAEKGTYGLALHGGNMILPAVTAFLLESPAVAKKASLDAVWNELKYFLVFEEWFGGDGSSFVSWFRLQWPKCPDDHLSTHPSATDRLLILKDGNKKGLDDFEYTIRTFSGARALTWSRVYFNGTLMLTFFVLALALPSFAAPCPRPRLSPQPPLPPTPTSGADGPSPTRRPPPPLRRGCAHLPDASRRRLPFRRGGRVVLRLRATRVVPGLPQRGARPARLLSPLATTILAGAACGSPREATSELKPGTKLPPPRPTVCRGCRRPPTGSRRPSRR